MFVEFRSKFKFKKNIVFLFIIFHIVFSLFLNPSGHFSGDEGVYHLMARSFSTTGTLDVWNGFQEFPSPELALWNIRGNEGHLVPPYPYLYPVLAFPFYKLAGLRGLFILNAIAFLGVIWLCYLLARKLFQDRDMAQKACSIFILATYAWEYSQGVWPHALTILFTTGAVYLALEAIHETNSGRSSALAFGAGLAAGFGAGVRLDAILVFPALALPFLFARPSRPIQLLATCVGILPGLIILAITNHLKFGVVSPFSYGSAGGPTAGLTPYLPLLEMGTSAVVGLWALTRIPDSKLPRNSKIAIAVIVVLLGSFFFAPLQQFISRLFLGAYQLTVDLRAGNISFVGWGSHTRTADGAIVYFDTLKKSLLQSCPYLTVLLLPLVNIKNQKEAPIGLGCLYLVLLIYIGTFSFFAWHGGLSFNMRYFLPILPFTSILTAYAWKELTCKLNRDWIKSSTIGGFIIYIVFLSFLLFSIKYHLEIQKQEGFYLTLPLLLALSLFFMTTIYLAMGKKGGNVARGITTILLVTSLVWSGLVAFCYDFPRVFAIRSTFAKVSQEVFPVVAPDSILFADFPDPLLGLFEKDRLRLAVPSYDNFKDFRPLIDFHLDAGRSVYASFSPETWQLLHARGLLKSLEVLPILKHRYGQLAQIIKSPLAKN